MTPQFLYFVSCGNAGKFGRGYNRNFPLPEKAGDALYLQTLSKALQLIDRFDPVFLVVCLGYDTMAGDPTVSFALTVAVMERVARRICALGRPLLVVQEGGYSLRNLRRGSAAFFRGLHKGLLAEDKGRTLI